MHGLETTTHQHGAPRSAYLPSGRTWRRGLGVPPQMVRGQGETTVRGRLGKMTRRRDDKKKKKKPGCPEAHSRQCERRGGAVNQFGSQTEQVRLRRHRCRLWPSLGDIVAYLKQIHACVYYQVPTASRQEVTRLMDRPVPDGDISEAPADFRMRAMTLLAFHVETHTYRRYRSKDRTGGGLPC